MEIKENDEEHLNKVIRHIENVRNDTILLGMKLLKNGEVIGRDLIGLGHIHDFSKIKNEIEWKFLREEFKETDNFKLALESHLSSNKHHPEYWHGIENMPRLYVAEFVCDIKARSNEFGTDLREWITESATKKFKFSKSGKVYKEVKEFVDLLLENPFK